MASQGTMGSNRAAVQLASGDCPSPSASSPAGEPGFDRPQFLRIQSRKAHKRAAEYRLAAETCLPWWRESYAHEATEWDGYGDELERQAEAAAATGAWQATQGV